MGNSILKFKYKFNNNTIINNTTNVIDEIIDTNNMDYCFKCDTILIYNIIIHCDKCNKCHNINKYLYCFNCQICVDPFNQLDIINHKKKCKIFS